MVLMIEVVYYYLPAEQGQQKSDTARHPITHSDAKIHVLERYANVPNRHVTFKLSGTMLGCDTHTVVHGNGLTPSQLETLFFDQFT